MKRVTLLYHIEAMLREKDKALSVALEANKDMVRTALESNEKRLAALNELRGDVATRSQVDALKERLDRMDGRTHGMSVSVAVVVTCITILLSVIGLYIALHRP